MGVPKGKNKGIQEEHTMWKEGTIGIPKKDGGYKAVHYWIKV